MKRRPEYSKIEYKITARYVEGVLILLFGLLILAAASFVDVFCRHK